VTIMPPESFILHAPGVGGHGAVPRAVAGGVWTPNPWVGAVIARRLRLGQIPHTVRGL